MFAMFEARQFDSKGCQHKSEQRHDGTGKSPACPREKFLEKDWSFSLQHRLEMAFDLITALVIGTYKI